MGIVLEHKQYYNGKCTSRGPIFLLQEGTGATKFHMQAQDKGRRNKSTILMTHKNTHKLQHKFFALNFCYLCF